jgi:hypothetical protein
MNVDKADKRMTRASSVVDLSAPEKSFSVRKSLADKVVQHSNHIFKKSEVHMQRIKCHRKKNPTENNLCKSCGEKFSSEQFDQDCPALYNKQRHKHVQHVVVNIFLLNILSTFEARSISNSDLRLDLHRR